MSTPDNPARADAAGRLSAVAPTLACPECGDAVEVRDRALRCARGHSFDIAKQGYVSLLTGASTKMTGDTAAMLDARAAFQGAHHFRPIAEAVTRAVTASGPATIAELGAGTGYYLAEILDAAPGAHGIALDVSKFAARRAARAHPRAASILADAWLALPIRDAALSHVIAAFAPRNPAEVSRVLTADGRFVVVTPTTRHLSELIEPLNMVRVDPAKDDRLTESLAGYFTRTDHTLVEYPMPLTHSDITDVVAMGPSAFHAGPDRAGRIAGLPRTVEVTASVTVSVYRK